VENRLRRSAQRLRQYLASACYVCVTERSHKRDILKLTDAAFIGSAGFAGYSAPEFELTPTKQLARGAGPAESAFTYL
jgi:hypothetical protein